MGSGVIRISYLPINSLTTRTLGSDDDLTPFVVQQTNAFTNIIYYIYNTNVKYTVCQQSTPIDKILHLQEHFPYIQSFCLTIYAAKIIYICSKYGFSTVISEGILYCALELCLLVGMLWADILP